MDRRKFLGLAIAGSVAAPAVMRASRVEAAEVEKMAGKLLVVGYPGSSPESGSTKTLANHIAAGRAGGALFLRHNVKSGAQSKAMAKMFINANRQSLIAIDQEGGKVQRLGKKHGFTSIPTAQWIAENKSVAQAKKIYAQAGRELKSAGFNMNMAPTVDIHDPKNPVIGKWQRSFSTDVERIAAYAGAFVDGFASAGVACSLKHFPGHGSSRGDSHDGFVDITNTWNKSELVPFQKLGAKSPMIMGGHLFHPEFSNGKSPVTFSQKALISKLRKGLGYQGVILTDDLDMGAIRKSFQLKEAIILALAAGNDLLLLSNSLSYDGDLPANAVRWISGAVKDERISQAGLKASYNRVMRVRKSFSA
ncbi:MAG: glycoside hydrolase family 3 N-terminal domain-containing protein [Rhizobiaceae bacterium]|nr:glycoside hydrolase family 3 N-terminal domain-containing protein [Rhizobiaceae bacterium]